MSKVTFSLPLSKAFDMSMMKGDNFANVKARALAFDNQISPGALVGTGKNNKITSADVKKVLTAAKKKEAELPRYTDSIPELVTTITDLSFSVREKFPFGGKEGHYQGAMEVELQEAGHMVQHEVAELYHYTKMNGEVVRMPHAITAREDLLLPREKLILELKATASLSDKDHCQLLRYMEERRKHSPWGEKTIGMLINYGDHDVEVWYMFYKDSRPQRVLIMQKPMTDFNTFVDTFAC
jgi:GxxExxY protein